MRNRFDILVVLFIIIVLNIGLFVFSYNYKIRYYKSNPFSIIFSVSVSNCDNARNNVVISSFVNFKL